MNWATGKIKLRRIDEEPGGLALGLEEGNQYNFRWSQLKKWIFPKRYKLKKQRILGSSQGGALTSEGLGPTRVIQTLHCNSHSHLEK